MFLTVRDNTGDYCDVMNHDILDVVQESLSGFDHFIQHFRFESDKIFFIFVQNLQLVITSGGVI
jgi:hypothetical protein